MINNLTNKNNFLTMLQITNMATYVELTSKKRSKNSDSQSDKDINDIKNQIKQAFEISSITAYKNKNDLNVNESRQIYIKYARVSTKLQLNNNSINVQLNSISTYLNNKNIDESQQYIITEYDSAWSNIPTILTLLLAHLKNVTICFANYDRFNRNINIFLQQIRPLLIKNKIKLLFVSDNKTYNFTVESAELNCLELLNKLIPCQIESEKKSLMMKKWKKRKSAKSNRNKIKICVNIRHH